MIENIDLSIAGVALGIESDDRALTEAVEGYLGVFPRSNGNAASACRCRLTAVPDRADIMVSPSDDAQLISSVRSDPGADRNRPEWSCDVYRDGRSCLIDLGPVGRLSIDPELRTARGWVVSPASLDAELRRVFIRLAVTELLKCAGVFAAHAAAVHKGGRGVVIPAAPSRGKTSLALALRLGGYQHLADDCALVRVGSDGPELLPFPVAVRVTEWTAARFPELELGEEVTANGKRNVVDVHFAADRCRPTTLLFPRIVDARKSAAEPLARSRALEDLLPHTMAAFDRETTKRHFALLTSLVEQCSSYRIYLGDDLREVHRIVDDLVDRHQ